jgi:hypothetical protein
LLFFRLLKDDPLLINKIEFICLFLFLNQINDIKIVKLYSAIFYLIKAQFGFPVTLSKVNSDLKGLCGGGLTV